MFDILLYMELYFLNHIELYIIKFSQLTLRIVSTIKSNVIINKNVQIKKLKIFLIFFYLFN